MTLAELREKLKADRAKLADLRAKAVAADATPEHRKDYKDALTALENLNDLITDAEREEALDAEAAKAAGGHKSEAARAVPAAPAIKLTFGQEVALLGAVAAKQGKAFKAHRILKAEDILADGGYAGFIDVLKKRAAMTKTNQTLTPQDGGLLLPTPNSASIIEYLRPVNTFLQGNPKRVPLIGGQFNQPRGASTAVTGYIGEGMKKPIGSPTFNAIHMLSKKIAGVVTVTEEALEWSLADLQAYIETDLELSLGNNVDLACYFGPAAAAGSPQYTPIGVLNRPFVNTFSAASTSPAYFANPKAPTVAEIDAIASRMRLAITNYNIPQNPRWAWVMNYSEIEYLRDLRGANGEQIYPTLEGEEPTWKGIKVLVTTQFPNNGGANTDESTLALIDFSHVLWGEDGTMRMKTSFEATIDPGTGTLIQLFQQNMMAVLVEMRHDIALEYDQAVSVLQHVRWGSLSPN